MTVRSTGSGRSDGLRQRAALRKEALRTATDSARCSAEGDCDSLRLTATHCDSLQLTATRCDHDRTIGRLREIGRAAAARGSAEGSGKSDALQRRVALRKEAMRRRLAKLQRMTSQSPSLTTPSNTPHTSKTRFQQVSSADPSRRGPSGEFSGEEEKEEAARPHSAWTLWNPVFEEDPELMATDSPRASVDLTSCARSDPGVRPSAAIVPVQYDDFVLRVLLCQQRQGCTQRARCAR
eukprot:1186283-Prorocentrum_minimum.AAC.2